MKKKLAYTCLTAAMAGGMALTSAGAASAGHCNPEGPGHSYFGTEHAQEHEGNEGGHRGFSSCDPDGKDNGNNR